jgi:EAL domain-containing protein (putative c-di-GMP-specific phosphodiesterase class I)
MARRAGTATVMEAVETAEDAAVLPSLGIDYAQGYFFLRPQPGRDLNALLNAGFPAPSSPPRLVPLDLVQPAS